MRHPETAEETLVQRRVQVMGLSEARDGRRTARTTGAMKGSGKLDCTFTCLLS